jgi:hypothetical protein
MPLSTALATSPRGSEVGIVFKMLSTTPGPRALAISRESEVGRPPIMLATALGRPLMMLVTMPLSTALTISASGIEVGKLSRTLSVALGSSLSGIKVGRISQRLATMPAGSEVGRLSKMLSTTPGLRTLATFPRGSDVGRPPRILSKIPGSRALTGSLTGSDVSKPVTPTPDSTPGSIPPKSEGRSAACEGCRISVGFTGSPDCKSESRPPNRPLEIAEGVTVGIGMMSPEGRGRRVPS